VRRAAGLALEDVVRFVPRVSRPMLNRVRLSVGRSVRAAPFESAVVAVAIVYAAFRLSPSSYALALNQLGDDATPLVGTPRAVRSDEWADLTPLFAATVNVDLSELNTISFWKEDLLNFFGLPLWNWGFVFKPQLWAFAVLPPALAYSIYWAAIASLMLVGWSLLLRTLRFSRKAAALLSLLIFFSPFVQAWWTTMGPQLAFFPWVVLAAIHIKSYMRVVIALTVVVPVWLLSLFYVPGVMPLVFLGLVLCAALAPERITPKRVVAVAIGGMIGAAITFLYFLPVLDAYRNSEYPGERWVAGGALPEWQALSQVLPGTTSEGYEPLWPGTNICEVSTVATWLPLLALCMVDFRALHRQYPVDARVRRDVRRIAVLIGAWLPITLWQVTPLMVPMSYGLGFGLSPEQRTLFASGVILVVASGYAVDRLPICVTATRLGIFAVGVVAAWLLASWRFQLNAPIQLRDELLVLLPVAVLLPVVWSLRHLRVQIAWSATVLVLALVPTVAAWGLFNPLQPTNVMFTKPDTDVTRSLDALSRQRPDAAIAVPGFAGSVLNGVGYRSVTQGLQTPSPELFRRYFPSMSEGEFEYLFDRVANVSLTDAQEPVLVQANVVALPLATMAQYAATP
jgi:hypothetical protein